MKHALLFAAAVAAALPALPASARPHGEMRYERHHGGWSRGHVVPAPYRSRAYVVVDYHRYRLRPPPRGYHYVRHGDDVVLAAIASGIIAAVLADALSGGYEGPYYDRSYYEEEEAYYGRGDRRYRDRAPRAASGVIQGPGGQTIWSETPYGRSYTIQGRGGQTIVTDGPNGRTYTTQGPGGQVTGTIPPPGY